MKSKKNTVAWQILEFIGEHPKGGHGGASLEDIQGFIWTLRGGSLNKFYEKDHNGQRKSRGFYCTALYGSNSYWKQDGHGGLLNLYCEKKDGKWFLKTMPEEGEKIYCTKHEFEKREMSKKLISKKITKDQFEKAKNQVIEEMEEEIPQKKFKVIQKWPGGPSEGTILTFNPKNNKFESFSETYSFPKHWVEQYHEYFRELDLRKTYKIKVTQIREKVIEIKALSFNKAKTLAQLEGIPYEKWDKITEKYENA